MIKLKEILSHLIEDPSAISGALLLSLAAVGAIFAPLLAPQNPYDLQSVHMKDGLLPPLWMQGGRAPFFLGTDSQGRGLFSTILYGLRTSLIVGVSVVAIGASLGMLLGLLCAFYESIIDSVIMRIGDTLLSFSRALASILFLGLLDKQGVITVIVALAAIDWVQFARVTRGNGLSVKRNEYVSAARASGASDFRIILKHIFPNVIPSIWVIAAVDFGTVIMLEATLSFLGVGVPPTEPSLGMMISQGRKYIFSGQWWVVIFPGLMLIMLIVGLNLVADWLREELNPRLQRQKL